MCLELNSQPQNGKRVQKVALKLISKEDYNEYEKDLTNTNLEYPEVQKIISLQKLCQKVNKN